MLKLMLHLVTGKQAELFGDALVEAFGCVIEYKYLEMAIGI